MFCLLLRIYYKEEVLGMENEKSLLYGREITEKEWQGERGFLQNVKQRPGFQKIKSNWYCQRCGTNDHNQQIHAPCQCGVNCFYCAACLNMGKIKKCSVLYSLPEPNQFPLTSKKLLNWEGILSGEQTRASKDIVKTILEKKTRLIWAVAGSGKTEMIFAGIEECLLKKGRVCIASPRIDVCLELAPRIQAAFPTVPQVVLYGKAPERYFYAPLVIATTHQLLRFREAFDLLIIDEVDSFPYHNDKVLYFGAEKSRKKEGTVLYLTATPPNELLKNVKEGSLEATILPARYHGHPLPEASCIWLGDWRQDILKQNKRARFLRILEKEFSQNRQFLLFLPHISLMKKLEEWLHNLYPHKTFTSVSAKDLERVEKVKRMREREFDFLMTTTILERGVTFRDIDVFVLGAEDSIFTEASLVQIAGRAGRHKDFPTGTVWFGHFGYTKAIKKAVRQIKDMNKQAKQRGLLNV